MVKARQLCLAGFFLLGSTACAGRQKAAENMIPVAKAITIYSAGGSVVSGVIDSAALGARRLRLPATVAADTPAFGPGDKTDPRNRVELLGPDGRHIQTIPFTPTGMTPITPWIHWSDRPSP
jgi:hypothetical protein